MSNDSNLSQMIFGDAKAELNIKGYKIFSCNNDFVIIDTCIEDNWSYIKSYHSIQECVDHIMELI